MHFLGRQPNLCHSARMRIVCPICSAAYEVRDALLAAGRPVRCARCGEEWVPISTVRATPVPFPTPPFEPPPAATTEPDDVVLPPREPRRSLLPDEPGDIVPRLSAMERLASRPARLPSSAMELRAAWAASIVLLVVFGWGLIAWRGDIMRSWPPSARLYDLVGLRPGQPAPPAR